MFGGAEFTVGVAVRPRVLPLPELPAPPPGVTRRRTRLSEIVDVAALNSAGLFQRVTCVLPDGDDTPPF